MFVKVADNEIVVGPQSIKGSGEGWYWYEGVHPHDAAYNEKIVVSVDGDVATGTFVVDSDLDNPADEFERGERNRLLAASDWTQMPDSPLSDADKTAWATYRTALRDVPSQSGFPGNIVWPTPPDEA